jgi:methionyl-tRNA formyltransferase
MRLLFAGTPEPAVPSLRQLLDGPHQVVAVLTRPDAEAGRGRARRASPVAALAEEAGIEVLKYRRPRDPEFLARLTELAPQACPIVAYGGLIPPAALAVPAHGWVNLHFSLLPAWRGAAPVQHAIWHGDDITGASTFQLEEGLDTGPVYGTVAERIRPEDTAGDLLHRLAESGAELLAQTLDGIAAGRLSPVPQPADGVSFAPKIEVDDARIDFHHPALGIDRQVRACTPAPGAWTTFRGARLKLLPARPDPAGGDLAPGELRADKHHVWAGTATAALRLGEVQAQGKKPMPAADWARGLRLQPGETFV